MSDTATKIEISRSGTIKRGGAGRGACLVIIHSRQETLLGKRIDLGESLIIGRGDDADLALPSDSVSRRHARIYRDDSKHIIEDLGSTNGTFLNGALAPAATLYRGDQIKIGDTILKYLTGDDVEVQFHDAFHRLAMRDGLTDVYNKRYFTESLEGEIGRSERHGRPLSLILFDVDHFKGVNDTYGHLAGDAVLVDIARRVGAQLRPSDVLARYGGEEFVLLLPDTPLEGAHAVAEKIRRSIEARAFSFEGARMAVTSSFGVAAHEQGRSADELVGLAD